MVSSKLVNTMMRKCGWEGPLLRHVKHGHHPAISRGKRTTTHRLEAFLHFAQHKRQSSCRYISRVNTRHDSAYEKTRRCCCSLGSIRQRYHF